MEKQIMFVVHATNDKIWNIYDLLDYLSAHQSQDISLVLNPEAIDCENLGLYKILDAFNFRSVKIYTLNLLEIHPRYQIVKSWKNQWLSQIVNIEPELHNWNFEKIFLAMYHRPTANRLGLASYLHVNYPEQSIVHFSHSAALDDLKLFEFDKLVQYDVESLINTSQLLPNLPMRAYPGHMDDLKKYRIFYSENDGISIYSKIFVDIVSESHITGRTFYPTEKIARPMWLKKPFVVFASANYLEYMRQLGFRTFGDCWDENYDGYEGRDRYLRILKLVDNLSTKSQSELEEMYLSMQYTLDHNYNLLKTQRYNKNIKLVE